MFLKFLSALALVYFPVVSMAYEGASVLPSGVRTFSVRAGAYTGISDKFDPSGRLVGIGDSMSLSMGPGTVSALNSEAQQLVDALNQLGPQQLGDRFHPGNLIIDVNPNIQYVAPVFAMGLNSRWTLGFGVPIIRYTNQIQVRTSDSNLQDIRNLAGGLDARLDEGLQRFSQGMPTLLYEKAEEAGYYLPSNVDQSYLGDISLVSLYQLVKMSRLQGVLKTTFTLPTGPSDNPDDLTDLANFRKTAMELAWIQDYEPLRELTLGYRAAYQWNVPDQIDKRVPESDTQYLVPAERRETLQRDRGDVISGEVNLRYLFFDSLELAGAIEQGWKAQDTYAGSRDYNYGLLERNTDSSWTRIKAGIEINSVRPFLKKMFGLPGYLSYAYGNVVAGRNVERQISHEVVLSVYF